MPQASWSKWLRSLSHLQKVAELLAYKITTTPLSVATLLGMNIREKTELCMQTVPESKSWVSSTQNTFSMLSYH